MAVRLVRCEEPCRPFGAHIFGVGALAEPASLVEVARLAEQLGYHSVFLADHIMLPRHLESKYPYAQDGGFPYDPDKNWLEHIATHVIHPYQRGA